MIDEGEHQCSINAITLKSKNLLPGGNRKNTQNKKRNGEKQYEENRQRNNDITMEGPVSYSYKLLKLFHFTIGLEQTWLY